MAVCSIHWQALYTGEHDMVGNSPYYADAETEAERKENTLFQDTIGIGDGTKLRTQELKAQLTPSPS